MQALGNKIYEATKNSWHVCKNGNTKWESQRYAGLEVVSIFLHKYQKHNATKEINDVILPGIHNRTDFGSIQARYFPCFFLKKC